MTFSSVSYILSARTHQQAAPNYYTGGGGGGGGVRMRERAN